MLTESPLTEGEREATISHDIGTTTKGAREREHATSESEGASEE